MTGRRGSRLIDRYDAIVTDLDGVVYRGHEVVPPAAATLEQVRKQGVPIVFLTNNSGSTRDEVAGRLRGMGVRADPGEVLTSAGATVSMLTNEGRAGSSAFVIGGPGIRQELTSAGVVVVDGEPERTDLVVVGWDQTVDYAKLRRASLLVQRGAHLVATNADASFPAPDGLWPGAGALLASVTTTTGAHAAVAGKPGRAMFDAARQMAGASTPLMVGDRLDTDIAGGAAAGWDTLFVLSGVSTRAGLIDAPALPTYVGADLSAILEDRLPAAFDQANDADLAAAKDLLAAVGLADKGLGEPGSLTIVCRAAGRIAATATVSAAGDVRYLRSVAVAPDRRGQGLGLLASATAIRSSPPLDAPVFLFTEDAEPLFAHLGFRRVGADDVPPAVAAIAERQRCRETSIAMVLDRGLGDVQGS